ncbi:MAG TPA: ferritin-like domain-containing protein [Planctomycetota bacterium]|nr:ferritin-like domain-containing protein [Planctomycetota bacterium]
MSERALVDVLEELIHAEQGAQSVLDAAVARLAQDEVARRELRGFRDDHARHLQQLMALANKLGRDPRLGRPRRRRFRMLLASAFGDARILRVAEKSEALANRIYERALAEPGVSDELRQALERGFEDERRHRAWLRTRLRSLRDAA